MITKTGETSETGEYAHKIVEYINENLQKLKWKTVQLAHNSNISQGEISKILKGNRKGLGAKTFYLIYSAFGDNCARASEQVYPNLNLSLRRFQPRERNDFGEFMQQFEKSINSIEEIAAKTGIKENRLKDLYYRKGSLEAYELLIIERAVGKKSGELFEMFYKK